MASDPELQRFAGSFVHRLEDGQSRIGRPMTAARTCVPWQHLSKKVLHFVCELRGPIATKVSIIAGSATWLCCGVWVPAFAGTTAENRCFFESGLRLRENERKVSREIDSPTSRPTCPPGSRSITHLLPLLRRDGRYWWPGD